MSATSIKKDIFSSKGQVVGFVDLNVYPTSDELGERFRDVFDRVPFLVRFPLGVFEKMEIERCHRGNGFSHQGMQVADAEFTKLRVKTGMMMAAAEGFGIGLEEKVKEMEWKMARIYEPAGWQRLRRDKWFEPYLLAKQF